jgi:hypothetical protein
MPYDRADVDLHVYRQLAKRWHDWAAVATACRALAQGVLDEIVEGG